MNLSAVALAKKKSAFIAIQRADKEANGYKVLIGTTPTVSDKRFKNAWKEGRAWLELRKIVKPHPQKMHRTCQKCLRKKLPQNCNRSAELVYFALEYFQSSLTMVDKSFVFEQVLRFKRLVCRSI